MDWTIRVDAAPGFEATVRDNIAAIKQVKALIDDKQANFDLLVLIQCATEGDLQALLDNELYMISGVVDLRRDDDVASDVVARLAAAQ